MLKNFNIGQINVKVDTYSSKIFDKILSNCIVENNFINLSDKKIYVLKKTKIFANDTHNVAYLRKEIKNWTVHIYDSEIKGFIIYCSCENKFVVVGESDYDCTCLFKATILKIYSDQFLQNSIAFHASAVEYKNEAYAFLGNGNTGKSTILFSFVNSVEDVYILNDDFIMCTKNDDDIFIHSLPLKCAIRKDSLNYLTINSDQIFINDNYLGNGDQYYIDVEKVFKTKYTTMSKLKYLFFFKTSNATNSIKLNRVVDKKSIVRLLTINMSSFKIHVDEQVLLNIINSIIENVRVFELTLPSNMNGFPKILFEELEEYASNL